MISAIIYTSNSGYTKEYATLLGQATGLPVNDLSQMKTPQPDKEVIFLGWLMAGNLMGLKKARKLCKVCAVSQVGMGPASQAASRALKEKQGLQDAEVFTLQGGFDIKRLHGPYKWIMLLKGRQIKKQLEEKGKLNPAQQLTYDMVTKGASNVSVESLSEVIDWVKQHQ